MLALGFYEQLEQVPSRAQQSDLLFAAVVPLRASRMEKDFGLLPNRGTLSKDLGLDLLSEVPLVEGRERWWSPRLYNKERRKT